ncbi:MAG: PEGA domain-containing protein [Pseudomonadota bacterium]
MLVMLLAAAITMQPIICCAQSALPPSRSAAVEPFIDGDADDESRDIAQALSSVLRLMTDHRIADSKTAGMVLAYQDVSKPNRSQTNDAASTLARAKEHYFSFQYHEAVKGIDQAISMLEGAKLDEETGPLLVDAYISKALIAKSKGSIADVKQALGKALLVNPLLDLKDNDYPPSLVALFEELKAGVVSEHTGAIKIKSKPEGADVFLNGIRQGVTPLRLNDLPQGSYSLLISANKYESDKREVELLADKELMVKARLKWIKNNEPKVDLESDEGASNAISKGLELSNVLKVDRVILVDADAKAQGVLMISARTVDRKMQAGLKPIVLPDVSLEYKHNRIAELAGELADQLDADVLSDPARTIDPIGQGDPVLLAKRKKPLMRRPLFWGAIGVAVAGAIVGGIVAAMSGSSKTGTVKVSFK